MNKEDLIKMYLVEKKSVAIIASVLNCSNSKVNYWLKKYCVEKRTINEAIYVHKNPNGDPFTINKLTTKQEYFLYGLGMGLYWGEGTKKSKNSVRLGNSDPYLIKAFLLHLNKIYGVKIEECSFGLQIFKEMDLEKTQTFWQDFLGVSKKNFYKTMIKEKQGTGSYKNVVEYGVLTIYFNNTKLRNLIISQLEAIKKTATFPI